MSPSPVICSGGTSRPHRQGEAPRLPCVEAGHEDSSDLGSEVAKRGQDKGLSLVWAVRPSLGAATGRVSERLLPAAIYSFSRMCFI